MTSDSSSLVHLLSAACDAFDCHPSAASPPAHPHPHPPIPTHQTRPFNSIETAPPCAQKRPSEFTHHAHTYERDEQRRAKRGISGCATPSLRVVLSSRAFCGVCASAHVCACVPLSLSVALYGSHRYQFTGRLYPSLFLFFFVLLIRASSSACVCVCYALIFSVPSSLQLPPLSFPPRPACRSRVRAASPSCPFQTTQDTAAYPPMCIRT